MFDTLKVANTLRGAGLDDRAAHAVADMQKYAIENSGLATKADIARLEIAVARLEERIKAVFTVQAILTAMIGAMFLKIFLG